MPSFISIIALEFLLLILKFNMQSFPINSAVSILTLNSGVSLNTKYSGLIPITYFSSLKLCFILFSFNKLKSIEKSSPTKTFPSLFIS